MRQPVSIVSVLFLGLCAFLTGCGVAPSTTGTTSAATTNPLLAALSPNIELELTYAGGSPTPVTFFVADLVGNLTAQGNTVSGTLRYFTPSASPCISSTTDIAYTGSIDANNVLNLTTTSFSGTIATISLPLPAVSGPSGIYQTTGPAQLIGGTCAAPVTQVSGVFVPSVTGTFTGTLTPSTIVPSNPATGPGGTAVVALTQSSSANADGQFPVTGTLNFTSPSCTLTTPVTGIVTGLNVQLSSGVSSGSVPGSIAAVQFHAGVLYPGLALSDLDVAIPVSGCSDIGFYSGSLTRQ